MGESFVGVGNISSEKDKALSTQHQLRVWDALLEVRIRMQKILLEVNKLPQNETFDRVLGAGSASSQLPAASRKALGTIQDFVDNLLELQDTLTLNHPETDAAINKKKGKAGGNETDEGIEDDEEITSEEDIDDDEEEQSQGQRSKANKGQDEDQDQDVASDSDPEEEDEGTHKSKPSSPSPPKSRNRKRKLEEYEKQMETKFQKYSTYRDETIQKWNDKTQMSFGKFRGKSSSGPQIPTLKQISHILSDRERLIKRTQVKRTNYLPIGKLDANNILGSPPTEESSGQDEEIFDDDDFYHQLLRELIDRKTTNVNDPVQLSRQWLELQKMRTKLKRVVDTDASKGRKIRYDVHPKLVNFMAPQDDCVMSESAVKELMSSLFGKLSN